MLNKNTLILLSALILLLLFRSYIHFTSQKDGTVEVTGVVSSDPYLKNRLLQFRMGKVFVLAKDQDIQIGDNVTISGELKGSLLIAKKINLVEKQGLEKRLEQLRTDLAKRISSSFPSPQAELLTGILLGIKKDLPKNFEQSLVATGTIHVVVVSGYNIALTSSFLLFLAPHIGRKKAAVLAVLAVVGYTILVGPSAPTLRAAIMGILALVAVILGRQALSLYLLFLSAYLLVLFSPDYLFDVSFQLTFMATLGVISFTKWFSKHLNLLPGLIRDSLATTLAAQVLVMPIIFYYFGNVSLSSPLVNSLVLWTVPVVTVLGIVLLISTFVSTTIGIIISQIVTVPLSFFVLVVNFWGQLRFLNLTLPKESLFLLAGYYLILLSFVLNKLTTRLSKK